MSTLRDRQRAETNQHIRRCAVQLIDQHGFDGVTVRDIAQAAGISERTFFNHFATKEEAVLVPDDWLDDSVADELLRDGIPLLEAVEAATLRALTLMESNGDGLAAERRRILRRDPRLLMRSLERAHASTKRLVILLAERTGTQPDDAVNMVAALIGAFSVINAQGYFLEDEQTTDVPGEQGVRDVFAAVRTLAAPKNS